MERVVEDEHRAAVRRTVRPHCAVGEDLAGRYVVRDARLGVDLGDLGDQAGQVGVRGQARVYPKVASAPELAPHDIADVTLAESKVLQDVYVCGAYVEPALSPKVFDCALILRVLVQEVFEEHDGLKEEGFVFVLEAAVQILLDHVPAPFQAVPVVAYSEEVEVGFVDVDELGPTYATRSWRSVARAKSIRGRHRKGVKIMAERGGFEPPVPLMRAHTLSKRAHSAALTPLRRTRGTD